MGRSCMGQLVNLVIPRTQNQVTWESWLNPRALGPRSPRTTGGHCWPLGMGPNSPGQLVDHPGPQIRARVTRDSWSKPQVLGHGPECPESARRTCGPLDPSASRLGGLFDPTGLRTRA